MKVENSDVVIVGSGVAGLICAFIENQSAVFFCHVF